MAPTFPPTHPVRAAVYIRVSTDEQAKSGLGLTDQEQRCRALALARGWEVGEVYADDGVSGVLDPLDRPAAARLMADALAGRVNAIIVLKLDRFARRAEWVHRSLRELEDAGVAFVSVTEPMDTSSAMGRAFIGLAAVFAQLERDLISERTRAAISVKQQRGERIGGAYMGIRVVDGKEVEVPEERAILEEIRKMRKRGRSLRWIADAMHNRGYPTKRGGQWDASTVAKYCKRMGL